MIAAAVFVVCVFDGGALERSQTVFGAAATADLLSEVRSSDVGEGDEADLARLAASLESMRPGEVSRSDGPEVDGEPRLVRVTRLS